MPPVNYSQNLCDVTGNTEEDLETIEEDRVWILILKMLLIMEAEKKISETSVVNVLNSRNVNDVNRHVNDDEAISPTELGGSQKQALRN